MAKRLFLFSILFHLFFVPGNSQELMPKIEDSGVTELLNSTAVVTLNDGIKLVGTVASFYLSKGHLIDVSLKLQDGSKRKFRPTEIFTIKVRCSKPTMFTLIDDSGNIIEKVINTQYVFEHPFKTSKKVKPDMMQLLNPVFDSRIKIFPYPNDGETRSISIKGVPLSGGKANSYIFVKGNDVMYIKRTTYDNDFKKVFSDCEKMIESMSNNNIEYEGLAGHVLLYNHHCGSKE